MEVEIVVVGAGPAGSATGLLLARRGYRVAIFDRAKFPRPKPCGEYLSPDTVRALDRLGVLSAVAAAGTSLSGMYVAGCDGTAVWAPFPAGRGLLVPRERLDHILLTEAARSGADVIEECRVDSVTPGAPPIVTGRCRGRPFRQAPSLVVGADGLRSVVARRSGPLAHAVEGRYTVGAHFEGLHTPTPRGELHVGPGWYAGATLYGNGIGNIVVAVTRAAFRRGWGNPEVVFTRACAPLPRLTRLKRRARRVTPFVSVGPLGYTRRRAVDNGILLVGDAAGTIDPMTGEGIALALRGAELAALAADRALLKGDLSHRQLADYEHARTAAFRDIWLGSRILQWIIRRPALASSLFRGLARDPASASTLLGVVSDLRPIREVLAPGYLARLLIPRRARPGVSLHSSLEGA